MDFTQDHPNNPATQRVYKPSHSGGGPVLAALHFADGAEGGPGYAHEGAIGALADSVAGFCNQVNSTGGPTLNLTIDFIKPVPLGACARIDCRLLRIEQKKVFLDATITSGLDKCEKYAECRYLFFNGRPEGIPLVFQLSDFDHLKGVTSKHPALNIASCTTVGDDPFLKEFATKWQLRSCTNIVTAHIGMQTGQHYTVNSVRMSCEYYTGADLFVAAYMACGECMGPPPNVHGGCIFTWHADAVIACMRMHATALGAQVDQGALKKLSVNYRKFTPLWLTYGVRVRVVSVEHGVSETCSKFVLRSELVGLESGVLHSDADSEFECSAAGHHRLLPQDMSMPFHLAATSSL